MWPRKRYLGQIDEISFTRIRGWVADSSRPDASQHVTVIANGSVIGHGRANISRQDLINLGIGSGSYGFDLSFHKPLSVDELDRIEVYSNADEPMSSSEDGSCQKSATRNRLAVRWGREAHATRERLIHQGRQRPARMDKIDLIEVRDVLSYLRTHLTVTGIQRVVCELIHAVMKQDAWQQSVGFCVLGDDGLARVLGADDLQVLVGTAFEGRTSQNDLARLADTVETNAVPLKVSNGQRVVFPGAYWTVPSYASQLLALRRDGVKIGTYIHDIIPVTHPEWVPSHARLDVVERAVEMLILSDFFMTNSVFVRDELQALMQSELGLLKPCEVVLLPHETPATLAGRATKDAPSTAEFVLCVGTIEGRKNHILLFRVWAALIRRYGFDRVPDLVLVGRWGWNVDEFRALMEGSANLHGKIKLRVGLSDAELGDLYRSCLFTVFPSFVEGWGLPVGESLAAGTFCIASRTSSIPEVGETFADYFDPHDYFDALGKIERCLVDRAYLKDRTDHIATSFRRRSWRDFAEAFLAAVRNAPKFDLSREDILPELAPGRVYAVTGEHLMDPTLSWSDKRLKFTCSSGWGALEDWGSWSNVPSADVRFRCPEPAGTAITLLLALRLPEPHGDIAIRAEGPGETPVTFKNGNQTWVSVDTIVGADGGVTITLERNAKDGRTEPHRALYIGYSGLAYFRTDNADQKMKIACTLASIT